MNVFELVSTESDLSKFTLDLGLTWLNCTAKWAKSPVSLKLKFSIFLRIHTHNFRYSKCAVQSGHQAVGMKLSHLPCKAQSDPLLLYKTSHRVPLHSFLVLGVICMLWCQGTLFGKSHFVPLCAKVWKASSVLKIIPSFWWVLLESTGCAKKLEYLKGFQKMVEFVKVFVLPLLEISVCKLLFKCEMKEFSLVEVST